MPVQLTICRLCIGSRPDVYETIVRLAAAHPQELVVVELDCMAACDDVPAVMLETDYLPKVSPRCLAHAVGERLGTLERAAGNGC
jgi:hypothetical protein